MRAPSIGLTLRTALLSWSVTLATLLLFVLVILPWQQRTFLQNLESKAHGVAVSLQGVAAGAAVNEDYSRVIEHAQEMLTGDRSLAYLVVTKNDGFSLIHDPTGWRSAVDAAEEWRPKVRVAGGGIREASLVGPRVFHFSQPFDYSGIQWGWIHVGLSLDAYDRSVTSLYRLTAGLGIVCVALSLFASVIYARRLVRPVLNLRETVQRVSAGDLAARAPEDRGDELGSLARSVNQMTEALLRRDEILGSVQFAAQRFLGAANWRIVISEVLSGLGKAAGASRAYIFENHQRPGGPLVASYCHEWVAPGIRPELANPDLQHLPYVAAGFGRWVELFQRHEIVAAGVTDLPASEQPALAAQGIQAVLVIPIFVDDVWWGFIGLDDCAQRRAWSDAVRDSLQAVADMIGGAITRQRAQDALLEAKATLEQRVLERTIALQRENLERKEAEAAVVRSLAVINATLESTLDGIMVVDRNGRVMHFNRRFVEMWRIAPEFLTSGQNRNVLAKVAALLKDPPAFLRRSMVLHRDRVSESHEVIEFKDGRIFEMYTRPQQFDANSSGRVWCFRDITERRRAEAEITYERDLLQTLLDSLPDTLYFKDLESRFVRVSRSKVESALAHLRERHRLEQPPDGAPAPLPPHLESAEAMGQWLFGRSDFDVFSDDGARPRYEEEQEIIRTGQPITGKVESMTLPSGATAWYLVTKMPWRDEQGRIIGTYGVSKNITVIKEAEEKLSAVHQELMQTSRQAGMAEVATGVLHNVGNVLNSVNVSATLVRETLQSSEVATLGRVAQLLRSRTDDLAAFLTTDPKGRLIPNFVIQIADHLAKEHAVLLAEHEQLARSVEHIKEIVAMQQNYARVSGVLEKVRIADLVGDALRIHAVGFARHRIEVVRDYAEIPLAVVDKHKVMQILVNLIQNAKHALDDSERPGRRITLGIGPADAGRFRISVGDNGVGIVPENLNRIFSHGFTTRANGHGFGLHSGAIAAREMGGSLHVTSAGAGLGATFTLELPLTPASTTL